MQHAASISEIQSAIAALILINVESNFTLKGSDLLA